MKVPKKVYVSGVEISIVRVSGDFGSDRYGEFTPAKQLIWLRDDLGESVVRSTLLHEILHALIAYDTIAYGNAETDRGEEAFVTTTESALFAFLTDPRNRAAVKFILGWD